jgi:hypothetical protein
MIKEVKLNNKDLQIKRDPIFLIWDKSPDKNSSWGFLKSANFWDNLANVFYMGSVPLGIFYTEILNGVVFGSLVVLVIIRELIKK